VLTTYYSASIPNSLFFWLVMAAGAVVSVVAAEQLCVRREMREGLSINILPTHTGDEGEDVELMRRD
jgi:hypothetical protein